MSALTPVLLVLLLAAGCTAAEGITAAGSGWFELSAPASGDTTERTANHDAFSLKSNSPNDVASVTRPTPEVVTQDIDMFHGEIRVFGPLPIERVAVGNGSVLRAEVLANKELLVIAEAAGSSSLRLWHIDGQQADYNIRVSETDPQTRFPMRPMVRMQVRMVEFRKSALERLGINWQSSVAGPAAALAGDLIGNTLFRPQAPEIGNSLPLTVKPVAGYFGITTGIDSRIELLKSEGHAVTLAEPVLSCASGETASFLAGGEVPYPSLNADGQTQVQFKEYGIRLDVSPQIDIQGNVQTSIDTEISQLDPSVSIQGTPGLLTRRARTAVNVRSGQTIVVSGLLSTEQGNDTSGLPGLGNLPLVGRLFRSRGKRRGITELVIFVTPKVVEVGDLPQIDTDRLRDLVPDGILPGSGKGAWEPVHR